MTDRDWERPGDRIIHVVSYTICRCIKKTRQQTRRGSEAWYLRMMFAEGQSTKTLFHYWKDKLVAPIYYR